MKAKKIYFSIFVSMLMLFAMSVNVFAVDEVAKIGDTPYETLENAISNVQSGETIKLIANVELTEGITINGGKTFTLDLNGNNISAPDTTLTIQNANVTITGSGKIEETSPNYGAIILKGSNENVANYTKVVVGKDVTLIGWSPLFVREYEKNVDSSAYGIVADVYGTIEGRQDSGGDTGNGIYINGNISAKENCPIINIYQSAKIKSAGVGIYAAGYGIWNIEGGTIEGQTAIYQKTGKMTINGETYLKANGSAREYSNDNGGRVITGDALVIDNCGYSDKAPEISIIGGYFSSANNKAIGSYTKDNSFTRIKGFVSGGYFSDYDNSLLSTGKAYVSSDKDGYLYMITDRKEDLGNTETSVDLVTSQVADNDIGLSGEALKADSTVLTQAGLDALNSNGYLTMAAAKKVLEGTGKYTYQSGDTIGIEVEVYMCLEVVSYSGDVLTVDITPRYDAYATCNDQRRAKLYGGGILTITKPVKVTIPLPEGFNNGGNYVYISHKGYIYEAQVSRDEGGRLVATFINPHGFSKFTITNANNAVARIRNESGEETLYTTLEQAVKEVKNDETIDVLKETTEVITVNKVITFTVIHNTNNETFPFEIKAGDSVTLTTEEKERGTVTYKFTAKETTPIGGGTAGGTTTYTVKFETNGGSEVENQKVKSNSKVTKPEDPTREGYKFEGWFVDEELESAYDFDTKVTKSFTLYAKWEEEYKNPFVDVKRSQWFYDAIKFANQNKIFNGMSSTTFEPDTAMTRAMFVTVLYRLVGEPEVNGESKFVDVVEGSYYEKAVIWAEKYGIVKGISDTEFAPDVEITREQMSAIMHRFAKYMGYDVSVGEDTNILSYEDFAEISEYAIPSMQWAVGAGLMKGQTDSILNPRATTTRAEVATLLQRFKNNN